MTEATRGMARLGARSHLVIFVSCALVCVVVALVEGKDFNWDLRNYHIYGPWALLGDRYGDDWMAAGPQGYLNPIAHIPLYLMVSAGLNDRLIVALLAIAHAFGVYFICLIAQRLFISTPWQTRCRLVAATALLGMLSPIFWGLVGTSFTDPIVAALLLASLYACMRAAEGASGRFALSGLLYGISVGLKLTNLLFAPAIAVAVILAWQRKRPWSVIRWSLASAAGLLLSSGASAFALYRAYGSPTFPLFNSIFASDFASTSATNVHDRFVPWSLLEFFIRPLRMLDAYSWIYIENSAPDIRFLVVFLLLPCAAIVLWRRRQRAPAPAHGQLHGTSTKADRTIQRQFWGFLAIAWACWLQASGNGRYAVALSLLAGPAIVILLAVLWRGRGIVYAFALIVTIQGYLLLSSYNHRWSPAGWAGRWFDVEVGSIDHRPHGYILIDANTNSEAFPFLNPASAYFAISGQMAQLQLPAVARRLAAFKHRWNGQLRLLTETGDVAPDRIERSKLALLALHGMRPTDPATHACSRIKIRADHSGNHSTSPTLLSCPLIIAPVDHALQAKQRQMQAVFDKVAAACRIWFPTGDDTPPVPRAAGWQRRYGATDVTLFSWDQRLLLSRSDFGPFDIPLGTIAQWNSGHPPALDCRTLPQHYQSNAVPIRNRISGPAVDER